MHTGYRVSMFMAMPYIAWLQLSLHLISDCMPTLETHIGANLMDRSYIHCTYLGGCCNSIGGCCCCHSYTGYWDSWRLHYWYVQWDQWLCRGDHWRCWTGYHFWIADHHPALLQHWFGQSEDWSIHYCGELLDVGAHKLSQLLPGLYIKSHYIAF